MNNVALKAPFPWFGGESRAAPLIWEHLGEVQNYVEPFAGSLGVLLGAPYIPATETVNDLDGFIANFWRSVALYPEETARHVDWPVNENDLHARHAWLVEQRDTFTERLEGDPGFCDPKIAGWWAWGICCWIGSGWCSGNGPWVRVDGQLVHLGNRGQGVNRQLVHLGSRGQGAREWFQDLAERLRNVRVCCGDWTRVIGPSPTTKLGVTGVLLDPPYSNDERCDDIYAKDSGSVACDVRRWAINHGDDPMMRIALCGYDTEHAMPDGWTAEHWKTPGGYGSQGSGRGRRNSRRETIWFSPHCVNPDHDQMTIFDRIESGA